MKLTWEDIKSFSVGIHEKTKDSNITDVIAIARGGIIPATIISYAKEVPLHTVSIKSYNDSNKRGQIKIGAINIYKMSDEGTVLIVDDICDSGYTMKAAHKLVLDLNPYKKIVTATLIHRPNDIYTPDVYHTEAPEGWVYFPWDS